MGVGWESFAPSLPGGSNVQANERETIYGVLIGNSASSVRGKRAN
jgi:hypothetical protein